MTNERGAMARTRLRSASSEAEPIASLLSGLLKQVEQQHGILTTVRTGWGKLVGKRVSSHSYPVSFRRGRLVVLVDEPGDAFVLHYQRAQLLKALQASTGGRIAEVVFRPGSLERFPVGRTRHGLSH